MIAGLSPTRRSMPLTGVECVSRVYTDHAVFLIEPEGVAVRELFGITFADLEDLVEVPSPIALPPDARITGCRAIH